MEARGELERQDLVQLNHPHGAPMCHPTVAELVKMELPDDSLVGLQRRIMERLEQWNVERGERGLSRVGTGIGVACGEVVVGNIGSSQRLEYTAIGDAVNLSSRLCSHAEAGELVASDAVKQAVPDAPFERIGPIQVKGVKEPVLVHKITFG